MSVVNGTKWEDPGQIRYLILCGFAELGGSAPSVSLPIWLVQGLRFRLDAAEIWAVCCFWVLFCVSSKKQGWTVSTFVPADPVCKSVVCWASPWLRVPVRAPHPPWPCVGVPVREGVYFGGERRVSGKKNLPAWARMRLQVSLSEITVTDHSVQQFK